MLLSIFINLIDKALLNMQEASTGYENCDLDRYQLAKSVSLGRAFAAQLKGPRKSENFLGTSFVAMDIDQNLSYEEAKAHPLVQRCGCLMYRTASDQKDGQDRFRIVFEMAYPIYEAETYCYLILGLMERFPQADPSAKDPARLWFGSSDCEHDILNGLLDRQTMEELIARGKEIEAQKAVIKRECSYDLPIEDTEKMLTFIDPQPGYDVWRNICFALGNAYGDDAIDLINSWSPDDKHRGRHLRQLVHRSDGRITLGTVLYHAIQGGYKPPEIKKRTAEQVVYQDVFNNGFEYATIGFSLYSYEEGYYKELPDALARRKIAEYLNVYPTKKNENGYANDAKTRSALSFVKSLCQIPSEEINPPGINLKNGFLRPVYKPDRTIVFELLKHTSERYCTYKADFEYLPATDGTEFQAIMDSMLPTNYQEILFRLLGATIDVQKVREIKGRAVRLLLLYGVGSNGKDTIKEWMSMLYGGNGLTSVPLQAFRKADKDRSFDLYPLVYSRLNWSSENAAISIDTCQTLKNFVTGDDMNVEAKNVQGITIKPKAIGMFNLNELPHIETMQESISSRYAIIEFPNVFTSNPTKDNERPMNPRLKGDPEFIQKQILPALLNRIIKGFQDILLTGVNYSSTDTLMLAVRHENSHLLQFIETEGLIESSHEDGITARTIFHRYNAWCQKVGLIDVVQRRWNDPSPYDRIITSETQIGKRFKKFFPLLDSKAHGFKGRVLNVRFREEKPDFDPLEVY